MIKPSNGCVALILCSFALTKLLCVKLVSGFLIREKMGFIDVGMELELVEDELRLDRNLPHDAVHAGKRRIIFPVMFRLKEPRWMSCTRAISRWRI